MRRHDKGRRDGARAHRKGAGSGMKALEWLTLPCGLSAQTGFAAAYAAIDPDALSFGDAFYLCLVTATTVGYGDVSLTSTGSRLAACFHIVLSVLT